MFKQIVMTARGFLSASPLGGQSLTTSAAFSTAAKAGLT